MSVPVLTFFNNKGGVGKTSLVYHLAWMLTKLGRSAFVIDLDPQANLTAAFRTEESMLELWDVPTPNRGSTVYQCVEPLTRVGDIRSPQSLWVADRLHLLAGDLALSGFEELLSTEWSNCLGSANLYRPFRVITAFWQVMQMGARDCDADIVLVDVGPSLGAINRSALIATDFVVVPLAADLFSRQGLRNLGPTLFRWRDEWQKRRANWADPEFDLPAGRMQPIGYVVQQYIERLSNPVEAYDRWIQRMPSEYATSVLGQEAGSQSVQPESDENCVATVKHYRSLIPLGQDARKPIFDLTVADGAIGSHAAAAAEALNDFRQLAYEILRRMEAAP